MTPLILVLLVQTALPALDVDSFPAAAREAIAAPLRQASARPDDAKAVGLLATTLHAWEQWDASHQVYERLQRLQPKAFEWRYLDGVVLQRLARHADAAARFQEALDISPAYLPARVKRAEALFESGSLDASKVLFTSLAGEPAAEPVAQLNLGRIAAAAGDHKTAIVHLERAVTLFPELGAAHYALARSYRALARTGDASRALALHRQYGPRWPALDDEVLGRVTAIKDDPRALIAKGMKLAEGNDLEGAIAAHEAALAADPSLADAHSNLISLYARAGNFAKADQHYRAVVALGVNLGEAHYDYGVMLAMQSQWERAAEAYGRALAVNPMHAEAHNNLGQIFERDRRFDEAARAYRQALESRPGFRLARFNLGRMLIASGEAAAAVAELQRIVEPRDAEAPRYLFALSVAHVRAGRKDEAVKWAREALSLALEHGQRELAAAIERDLARLR